MKTDAYPRLSFSVLVVLAMAATVHAFPVADNSSSLDYLVKAQDLSSISIGAFAVGLERAVDANGSSRATLEGTRMMGYLSYHVWPWISVYGAVGSAQYDINLPGSDEDNGFEWGLGLQANLLDHIIKDPTFIEDRVQLRAGVHYTFVNTKLAGTSMDWGELNSSLTLHIVNDVVGNKDFYPESVGLYVGPAYSTFIGGGDDIEEDESLGITSGMDIKVNKSISLALGVTYFDEPSYLGSIDIRF